MAVEGAGERAGEQGVGEQGEGADEGADRGAEGQEDGDEAELVTPGREPENGAGDVREGGEGAGRGPEGQPAEGGDDRGGLWRCGWDLNPRITVLQTVAWPLGYRTTTHRVDEGGGVSTIGRGIVNRDGGQCGSCQGRGGMNGAEAGDNSAGGGVVERSGARRMVIRGGAFVAVAAVAVTGVAEANPTVSAEFPLDPRVATVPAEASLALARQPVACNPGGCLAVWKVPNAARTRSVAIRALRLGPSGAAVEPGIVVGSSETRSLDSAAVASDGSGYLVVWQVDGRSIVASRVSAAGAVLDPGGVVIATSDHALQDPMVAWNGRDYLVVWQAESPTTRVRAIRGARVSPAGVVRDPAGLAIGGAAAYRQQFPVVAAAGERFVVAWEDGRVAPSGDLYVARVAADGTVLDPAGVHPFATFRTRTAAALSSDGARVLLGWQDGMGIPGGNGVYAALLGADGVAVGPGTLVDPQYRAFSLAFDGLHHLAAWRTDTGLAYTRLTPEGAPLAAVGAWPRRQVAVPLVGAACAARYLPMCASYRRCWRTTPRKVCPQPTFK